MISSGFYSVSSANVSCYVTGSSELLVPGRVTAMSNIPQGSVTQSIDPTSLVGQPDVQQISVRITPTGTIDLDDRFKSIWSPTTHWIRALRLSDDCHSYNLQLKLYKSSTLKIDHNEPPKLILQAIRPIEVGQELLLWFSEDILAMLQMTFLTPANIQGQKKYVCNRCSTLYESPNPLKLHITLGCGKMSISTLWERLSNALNESRQSVEKEDTFNIQLNLKHQTMKQKSAIDLTKYAENVMPWSIDFTDLTKKRLVPLSHLGKTKIPLRHLISTLRLWIITLHPHLQCFQLALIYGIKDIVTKLKLKVLLAVWESHDKDTFVFTVESVILENTD
ncbi:unnamed protein product [Diabrotica balteata]|uniref:Uncharacterized protein n=1 Tax=Diabrotica balteata TaxID=107213 RepID=A0A9N9SNI2_DIABA|nr:unnamed protein product [Diabrotica balteata]